MYKKAAHTPSWKKSAFEDLFKPQLLLYVEDDDDNWEIAVLRLSKLYQLVRAKSDAEACRIVRERRSEISVVLMDIELRGSQLNGVELTQLLRGVQLRPNHELPEYARNLPSLGRPIVYVTAHGARYSSVQLMLSGADKVISKPVDFGALKEALGELMSERTTA